MSRTAVENLLRIGDQLAEHQQTLGTIESRVWLNNWLGIDRKSGERVQLVRKLAQIDQSAAKLFEHSKRSVIKTAETNAQVSSRPTVTSIRSKPKKRRSAIIGLMMGERLTRHTQEALSQEVNERFRLISQRMPTE